MKTTHIAWESWEPGDPLDEEHLAQCEQCQTDYALARFLHFQAVSAPTIEAPPFFAARVANLATAEIAAPIWRFVERAARQLIPVFALLLLATSFLIYRSWQPLTVTYDTAGILLEPTETESSVSVDDVVAFLKEDAGEDGGN